jgi:hypothetical protein
MAALMQRYGGMQPGGPHPWNMGMSSGDAAMGGPAPSNMGMRMAMGGPPPLPDAGLMAGNALPSGMGGAPAPAPAMPMTGGTSPPPVIPPALSPSMTGGQPAGMGDQMSGLLRLLIPGLMGGR